MSFFSRCFFVMASLFSLACLAASPAPGKAPSFVEGSDYEILPEPVRTSDPARIEVVEIFWYGCSHCYHFESTLEPWVAALPADVDFQRLPAIWNTDMETHARIYYSAKQLGVLEKMHSGIFAAMHAKKQKLDDEDEIADLFAGYGINKEQVDGTMQSFSVSSLVKLGESRVTAYQVSGTPEMVVNGKYHVTSRLAGSQEKMLEIVDFLVRTEREKLKK